MQLHLSVYHQASQASDPVGASPCRSMLSATATRVTRQRFQALAGWASAFVFGFILLLWIATPAAAQISSPTGQIIGGDCVITSSGGVKCWGTSIWTPGTSLAPTDVAGLSDIVAIADSALNFCFISSSGGLTCWGDNFLGYQTVTDFGSVVDVAIVDELDTSNNLLTFCGLSSSGGVKCMGENLHGDVGDGTNTFRLSAVDVVGLTSGVIDIDAGDYHVCALLDTGGVKCWGWNQLGQLGNGTTTSSNVPVDVVGISDAVALNIGNGYSCALTSSGGVKCWGGGVVNPASLTAVDVPGLTSGVIAVNTESTHACAVMANGGVKCWGDNTYGQLGTGSNTSSITPVDVVGLTTGAVAVQAFTRHSCAVLDTGGLSCWGFNGPLATGDNATWWIAGLSAMTSGAATISSGLTIDKSLPNPYPPVAGEPVAYTIVVTNTSGNNLTNVTVTDEPAPSMTMTGFTSTPAGTCNTTTRKCTLDSALAPGASATFEVTFDSSPTVGAVISNTAYVTADQSPLWTYPTNPAPVTPSVATGGGTTSTDLAITKSANVTQATTGSPIIYTLTVVNNGPNDATNVVATDVLPAGFTFDSASATGGGSCSESGGIVTCTWPTVGNGTTVTATINVTS